MPIGVTIRKPDFEAAALRSLDVEKARPLDVKARRRTEDEADEIVEIRGEVRDGELARIIVEGQRLIEADLPAFRTLEIQVRVPDRKGAPDEVLEKGRRLEPVP